MSYTNIEKIRRNNIKRALRDVEIVRENREWIVEMDKHTVSIERTTPGGSRYLITFNDGSCETVDNPPDGIKTTHGDVERQKSYAASRAVDKLQRFIRARNGDYTYEPAEPEE